MLTSVILKIFIPGYENEITPQLRTRCGIVSGITGIICNMLLIIVKIVLAVVSGSIAIAADAVNNISDACSGGITVAGFYIAGQPPDAEHPFGHGRTEYIAGLTVALLVMSLGINFLKDSIISIFKPAEISADTLTICIFAAAILIKCWMFFFYSKIAGIINSDVVKAAAYDSLSDCLGTLIVVVSLILARFTSFPVDGCAGVIVASMILWAGGSIVKDTVNKLLGGQPTGELVEKVRKTILACPGIDGVHDMIIHNYGENSYFITAHAEISSEGDRFSAHDILENAEVAVSRELSVHLLLHGDPYDKDNPEIIYWRSRMENVITKTDPELKLYDFRLHTDNAGAVEKISFHLLIPRRYEQNTTDLQNNLQNQMQVFKDDIQLDIRFLTSFV